MRLCHFSDSHLGAGENHSRRGESGLTLRQEDLVGGFTQAVDQIIALKPDLCIHSGDLFHAIRPSNKILAIAGQQLYRLAVTHRIPTIIIAGNHDSPKQAHIDAALQIFAEIDNLYIAANCSYKEVLLRECRVVAVPHANNAEEMKETVEACRPDPAFRFNILVTHGVAAGMPQFSMLEMGESELPVEAMKRFDYTALGHYHNYTQVSERIYYAGSTERLSQSERASAKGFLELTLDPFEVKFHELSTRPMIDISPIDASGLRGDQLADVITQRVRQEQAENKIVRLTIAGLTPEILNTIPPQFFRDIKQTAFSLEIRFEKAKLQKDVSQFGRAAFGRLDDEFARFLESIELSALDKKTLLVEAQSLLAPDE